jgi:hypothetical protein
MGRQDRVYSSFLEGFRADFKVRCPRCGVSPGHENHHWGSICSACAALEWRDGDADEWAYVLRDCRAPRVSALEAAFVEAR